MFRNEVPMTASPTPPEYEGRCSGVREESRRTFLLMGVGMMLAGCAKTTTETALMPGPVWRAREMPPLDDPAIAPTPAGFATTPNNVIPRAQWATGGPVPALMNRMLPIQHITIHHDGLEPFYAADQRGTAWRLDLIRRAHRNKGWGDVGYHLAVDREGRVWQGRALNWQGAHVKDHNEGNIGVVALGNFDRQSPTPAQLASLDKCVGWLMNRYKVPVSRVHTHQEWAGAKTACPGVNLQRHMNAVRKSQQIG
jgi:hypothetical protein